MKEITIDGWIFWVGENAQDNWNLLTSAKKENMNWLWFHLDKFSSAYVVLCATRKQLITGNGTPKKIIKMAAGLCKQNGKFRDIPKVTVIYTELRNIKKGSKVGQVVVSSNKTNKIVV